MGDARVGRPQGPSETGRAALSPGARPDARARVRVYVIGDDFAHARDGDIAVSTVDLRQRLQPQE